MRALFVLPLLLAAAAFADETADRAAIDRAVAALNRIPSPQSIYTADASISPDLDRLWEGKRPSYRVLNGTMARPTVTISHEPWGEASIGFPGIRTVDLTNPRILGGPIRFVMPDVATVDAESVYEAEGKLQRRPLFIVVKKEGADWKIDAVRVIAEPRP
jgi:hypothetical protein